MQQYRDRAAVRWATAIKPHPLIPVSFDSFSSHNTLHMSNHASDCDTFCRILAHAPKSIRLYAIDLATTGAPNWLRQHWREYHVKAGYPKCKCGSI